MKRIVATPEGAGHRMFPNLNIGHVPLANIVTPATREHERTMATTTREPDSQPWARKGTKHSTWREAVRWRVFCAHACAREPFGTMPVSAAQWNAVY